MRVSHSVARMNNTRYTTIPRHAQTANAALMGQRCAACQLQLCKSREQGPHAAMERSDPQPETINGKPRKGSDVVYTCQSCGTALVHAQDRNDPGWRRFLP
jgi:predicted RNA binding protein YcfA (HicA-like mRNA interferase family)